MKLVDVDAIDKNAIHDTLKRYVGEPATPGNLVRVVLEVINGLPDLSGAFYPADSVDGIVKEMDILINGESGSATAPKLCDIFTQLRQIDADFKAVSMILLMLSHDHKDDIENAARALLLAGVDDRVAHTLYRFIS